MEFPEGTPWWRQLVHHRYFDMGVGMLIVINVVIMALELEHVGINNCKKVGGGRCSSRDGNWPLAEEMFEFLRHFFCMIFLLELIVRVVCQGPSFLCGMLNIVD